MNDPRPGASILLAESDPGLHETIRVLLRARGFAVLSAYTPAEIDAQLAEQSVDGALIGDVLDGASGFEIAASLGRRPHGAPPLALLSRRLRRGDPQRARLAGAGALLTIPLDENALDRWLRAQGIAA
jgi:DNA-binding response OmpR family regulator